MEPMLLFSSSTIEERSVEELDVVKSVLDVEVVAAVVDTLASVLLLGLVFETISEMVLAIWLAEDELPEPVVACTSESWL